MALFKLFCIKFAKRLLKTIVKVYIYYENRV